MGGYWIEPEIGSGLQRQRFVFKIVPLVPTVHAAQLSGVETENKSLKSSGLLCWGTPVEVVFVG